MREIRLGAGVKTTARLIDFLSETFPLSPRSALQKAFRQKDIRVDGRRAAPDTPISAFTTNPARAPGAVVRVYIPDEILLGRPLPGAAIVYEDDRLLVVDKPRGMAVHPDRNGSGATLIELAREYLGAPPPSQPQSRSQSHSRSTAPPPSPSLCHRIDRNTGGLVVIAKDQKALTFMLEAMSGRHAAKTYRCVVSGRPNRDSDVLDGWLLKDAKRSLVRVGRASKRSPAPAGSLPILTSYKVLRYDEAANVSVLDASPLTGRTHQIRAHLASIGCPIIGDGKYCPNEINRLHRENRQLLWAYRLELPGSFPSPNCDKSLSYLLGKVFWIDPETYKRIQYLYLLHNRS